jgi:hypothetical protein
VVSLAHPLSPATPPVSVRSCCRDCQNTVRSMIVLSAVRQLVTAWPHLPRSPIRRSRTGPASPAQTRCHDDPAGGSHFHAWPPDMRQPPGAGLASTRDRPHGGRRPVFPRSLHDHGRLAYAY